MKPLLGLHPLTQHLLHHDAVIVELLSKIFLGDEQVLDRIRANLVREFPALALLQYVLQADHLAFAENAEDNFLCFFSFELVDEAKRFSHLTFKVLSGSTGGQLCYQGVIIGFY